MDGQSEAWTTRAQQGEQYSQIKLARDFLPNQTIPIDDPHCIVFLESQVLNISVLQNDGMHIAFRYYTNFASSLFTFCSIPS